MCAFYNSCILVVKTLILYSRFVRFRVVIRYIQHLLLKYVIRRDVPSVVYILLTNRCQLQCSYCGVSIAHVSQSEWTVPQWKRIIDELAEHGVPRIHFTGGEALLYKGIEELIAYAHHKGMIVVLETNGWDCTEEEIRRLKRSGLSAVCISIDSSYRHEHDALCGREGCFSRVVESVRLFHKYRIVCFASVILRKSLISGSGFTELVTFLRTTSVDGIRVITPRLVGKLRGKKEECLSDEEKKAIAAYLLTCGMLRVGKGLGEGRCGASSLSQITISPSGEVYGCSYVPYSFGNGGRTPFRTILKRIVSSQVFSFHAQGCPLESPVWCARYLDENQESLLPVPLYAVSWLRYPYVQNIRKKYATLFKSIDIGCIDDLGNDEAACKGIASLTKEEYGQIAETHYDYLAWESTLNPAGKTVCSVVLKAEHLVGQYLIVRRKWKVKDVFYTGGLCVRTIIAKTFRGRGMQYVLAMRSAEDAACKQIDFLYGLPNEHAVSLYEEKIKWFSLGTCRVYCKIINPRFVFRLMTVSIAIQVFLRWGLELYRIVCILWDMQRSIKPKAGCTVFPVHEFDERFDFLWNTYQNAYEVMSVRTAAFLNWRYCCIPGRTYICRGIMDEKGKVVGYYVLRMIDQKGVTVCLLIDFFCPIPSLQPQLFSFVSKEAMAHQADLIVAPLLSGMKKERNNLLFDLFIPCPSRFIPHPFTLSFVALRNGVEEQIYDIDNWYMTLGDIDW